MNIEELREEFIELEKLRFNIINCYIMGILKKTDIDRFQQVLQGFREKLYNFICTEETILEVAKMKSKVQHFNTEIIEDEDVLKMAYSNEF